MKLPAKFNKNGLLPAKDFELTLDELSSSMLVEGPNPRPIDWNRVWRHQLVVNLSTLANQLWSVGVKNIFINGSFVEEKNYPDDIDGYFECEVEKFLEVLPKLNKLDPHESWHWPTNGEKPRMWDFYKVELYPHYGQLCGIDHLTGYELQFPSAFRQSREFEPKGIVKLIQNRGKI